MSFILKWEKSFYDTLTIRLFLQCFYHFVLTRLFAFCALYFYFTPYFAPYTFICSALIFLFIRAHVKPYRRTRKVERFSQRVLEISLIAEVHKSGVVHLKHESRRLDRHLRDEEYFELFAQL